MFVQLRGSPTLADCFDGGESGRIYCSALAVSIAYMPLLTGVKLAAFRNILYIVYMSPTSPRETRIFWFGFLLRLRLIASSRQADVNRMTLLIQDWVAGDG